MSTQKALRHFRNSITVKKIESGALWSLDEENRVLVLVDEDQHVTVPAAELTMLNFFEVDAPDEINKH